MSTLANFNKLRSHMQIFILPWIRWSTSQLQVLLIK